MEHGVPCGALRRDNRCCDSDVGLRLLGEVVVIREAKVYRGHGAVISVTVSLCHRFSDHAGHHAGDQCTVIIGGDETHHESSSVP